MSTKLGTLTLDLVAKIGSFVGPIKDAEKQTRSSFDSMKKHVQNYGAIAIAGAAAVGAGVFAMANEYANAARELQTFASISNTTTQEFQKMAVGAQTMGISQEKLSDQLKDFNEKLGEFVTIGSGGAVDFFEQIAIKTEGGAEGARKLALEMQNLSGPQALQLYVDKLEEAGVTQQQMSFYLESMASDTTNLIPLLKNGGEGFKFWADAAERAGVIMDKSAIAKANELAVQMDLLDLQVTGAKNQFIQGLMPALVSVGNSMTGATTNTKMMSDAGETLGNVFKGVAATGMGVYAVVKMLSNAIAGLSFDVINTKKSVDMASQNQGWFSNLAGTKNIKTALLAGMNLWIDNDKSGISMAAEDNKKVIEDVGTAISNLYNNTVSEAVSSMAKIQGAHAGVTKGSDEWIAKQNESAKAASGVNKALQEQNRLLDQQKRDREQISKAYGSDFQNLVWDEKEQADLIKGSGFSDQEQTKYLGLVKKRFNAENAEYFKALNLDLNQHKWSEEKKLEYAYQMDREIAENDVKIADEVRESKLKLLDEQYAIELQKARFHAQNMQQAMSDQIKNLSSGAEDINARASMSPQAYAEWSLSNNRSNAQLDLKNQRVGVEQDIMTSDVYETDDDRYGALVEAHQAYRDGLAAIDIAYDQQVKDLAQSQSQEQLALWGGILSNGQNTFSQLTQSLKNSAGEQSTAYKTMFALQQGFSIASSLVAAYTAYTQAFADPSAMTLPQKFLGATAVMAALAPALATISSTSITGMAHDGIDSIPKEGTWLLDKGERVVDKRTNGDLKDFIAKGGGSGGNGDVKISQSITFADGGAKVDTQGQKEISQSLNNAMDAWARRESRQGGVLYKLTRG